MNKKEIEKKFGESSEKFGDRVLNDTQIEILRLIKGDEKISAATIAKRMNITKRAVEKSIKDLKVKGILIKFGSARGIVESKGIIIYKVWINFHPFLLIV
ncbi:MAG: helix-turn-helix domain-containing protein [Kandleria vitulina]|uniref:MarR family transcriptional regulator n=1 Tax=Kandleria vitulina TaxID=1630 RepID=UPI002E78DE76|nr:helix-turn-helix domain-containing protein [Kandleria vitulina]MEE0988850.1 helix-turn-helix domain-containing protein [Kandleria vitulina]